MSYGRNPHYIWSNGETMNFNYEAEVPEYLLNAFLYKILLTPFRGELKERIKLGKAEWMMKREIQGFDHQNPSNNVDTWKFVEVLQDKEYVEWMENGEYELVKTLLNENSK